MSRRTLLKIVLTVTVMIEPDPAISQFDFSSWESVGSTQAGSPVFVSKSSIRKSVTKAGKLVSAWTLNVEPDGSSTKSKAIYNCSKRTILTISLISYRADGSVAQDRSIRPAQQQGRDVVPGSIGELVFDRVCVSQNSIQRVKPIAPQQLSESMTTNKTIPSISDDSYSPYSVERSGSKNYKKCMENVESNVDQTNCLIDEEKVQDGILSFAFEASLKEADAEKRVQLLKAHKAWAEFREENCNVRGLLRGSGSNIFLHKLHDT